MSDDGLGPNGVPLDDEPRLSAAIVDALQSHAPVLDGHPAIVTSYVVIAEWADANGTTWLTCAVMPGTTSWKRSGMLHERLYDWPRPD